MSAYTPTYVLNETDERERKTAKMRRKWARSTRLYINGIGWTFLSYRLIPFTYAVIYLTFTGVCEMDILNPLHANKSLL